MWCQNTSVMTILKPPPVTIYLQLWVLRDSGRQDRRSTCGQGCGRHYFDYLATFFTSGNPLKWRQVNELRRFLSEEPAPTPRVVYRDRSSVFVLALPAFPPYIDWKPGKATVYNMVHFWQTGRYKNCHSNLLRRGNAATTSPLPPQPVRRRRPLLICSPRRRCCFQLHVIRRFYEPNAMSLLTRATLSY